MKGRDFIKLELQKPNARQKLFLRATNRFIAYGGARGGGKSWAVRQKATLLALNYPGIKILVLRRTFPELRENHILPLRELLGEIAEYREIEKAFTFANKSRLKFGYCDGESDVLQYQGQEYDVIFIDEATQFTEFQFRTLTACVRGANANPKRMYLTCNPGGVGHEWVKRLFIDRRFEERENPDDYTFVPAKVYDNEALLKTDTGYVSMLEGLPEHLRRAWLEGDWNVFAGQYFSEFREDIHVVQPFEIPQSWRRYFTMDYGLDMLAGYFVAMDERGRAYVYREIYQSGLIISDAAQRIIDCNENAQQNFAPPDLWNRRQDTGRSVAEIFAERGLWLQKADNARVAGWLDLKEWLKPYELDGRMTADLQIFATCPNLIRTLPALRFEEGESGDVASSPHELTHAPDAIRYFISGRPQPEDKQAKKAKLDFKFRETRQEFDVI